MTAVTITATGTDRLNRGYSSSYAIVSDGQAVGTIEPEYKTHGYEHDLAACPLVGFLVCSNDRAKHQFFRVREPIPGVGPGVDAQTALRRARAWARENFEVPTVQLIGVGVVRAKAAEDFAVGESMMWNYGYATEIVAVRPKGRTMITVTLIERGKRYERALKRTRLVGIA